MIGAPRINLFLDGEFIQSDGETPSRMSFNAYHLEITKHLGLFDVPYIQKMTNIGTKADAIIAFLTKSQYRTKQPNYVFDPIFYATQSQQGNLHPLAHYIAFGDAIGLLPNPKFWTAWINKIRPLDPDETALEYYLRNEYSVAPNPYFDPIFYCETYADVYRSGRPALKHYIAAGEVEKRNPHSLINWAWYSRINPNAVCRVDGFLSARWKDRLFPHPMARAEWATLPQRDLDALFEANLMPTVSRAAAEKVERFMPYELAGSVSRNKLSQHFAYDRAYRIEEELKRHYRENSSISSLKVSVIIPTRNRRETVGRAVLSVLRQSHSCLEVIVVDDGGSDGTDELLSGLGDKRIVYTKSAAKGVSAARNIGLDKATGDFVAFLDSDNTFCSDFLLCMLSFCEKNACDFAYASLRAYNPSGVIRYRSTDYDDAALRLSNFIDMNIIMTRRNRFRDVKFDETIRRCVDWDYILKLCAISKPVHVAIIGCNYFHGADQTDRITTGGPVWDCYRVAQRHRLGVEATVMARVGIVVPVFAAEFAEFFKELAGLLPDLPKDVKVIVVTNERLDSKDYNALIALLDSSYQPKPLLTSPDFAVMADFGIAMSGIDAAYWSVVDVRCGLGLRVPVELALAQSEPTVLCPQDSDKLNYFLTRDGDTGFLKLQYGCPSEDVKNWAPLLCSLLNVPKAMVRPFDFTFSTHLAMPIFVLRLSDTTPVAAKWAGAFAIEKSKIAEIMEVMAHYHASIEKPAYPVDQPFTAVYKPYEAIERSGALYVVPRVLVKHALPKIAVFTPSPNKEAGWGDGFFAESLSDAFLQLGIDCQVVYRDDWGKVGRHFDHVVHIVGIISPSLVKGASNAVWVISHPDRLNVEHVQLADVIFTASRKHAAMLNESAALETYFLPQCTAVTPTHSSPFSEDEVRAMKEHALFLGDSKKVLRPPIDELIQNWDRLFLVGPNWARTHPLGARYVKGYVCNSRIGDLYGHFGSVLNQHWRDMAKGGFVSNRLYDIAAAGGRFITDHCEGIPDDLLQFGHVWTGGPVEPLFQQNAAIDRDQRYEMSTHFAKNHSFMARAREMCRTWLKIDVPV